MKYLISLSLLFFTTRAFSKTIPTGHELARFVCQGSMFNDRKPLDFVVILEQTSSKTLKINGILYDKKIIDGSVLVALDNFWTDYAPFRMRVYRTSLLSDEKTEKQIIEELLRKKADLDSHGRQMDYTGRVSWWPRNKINFESTAPYDFLREMSISLENKEGIIQTEFGKISLLGDGFYICKDPILIPEMVEESI